MHIRVGRGCAFDTTWPAPLAVLGVRLEDARQAFEDGRLIGHAVHFHAYVDGFGNAATVVTSRVRGEVRA